MTHATPTTPRWALPLVCLLAVGAGVGGWLLFRREAPAPRAATRGGARTSPSEPRDELPADPTQALKDRVTAYLVSADKLVAAERKAKVDAAIDLLDRLERTSPSDPQVHFWRGFAAVMARDRPAAEGALTRAQSLATPKDPRVPFLQALVLLEFEPDRGDEALKAARRARALDPEFMTEPVLIAQFKALLHTATRLLNQRSPDYAVQNLRDAAAIAKALGLEVDHLVARRTLAVAFQRAGRWVEAQETWEALVAEHPGALDFEFGLANALSYQNKWAEALPHFTRVVEAAESGRVPPEQVAAVREARLRRGNCHRLLQHFDEARADIERYVKEHPDDGRGHYWLGRLHLDSFDDPQAALPFFERARALLPYCDEPLRILLQVYEAALPDAAKAEALRKELEEGKEARRKELERVARQSEFTTLCE